MVEIKRSPSREGWGRKVAERVGAAVAARALWDLIGRLFHQ
jgi:hypothetical protein